MHKKWDTKECPNSRGITLVSVSLKVQYIKENLKMKKKVVEIQLETVQRGFKPIHGVQDSLVTK